MFPRTNRYLARTLPALALLAAPATALLAADQADFSDSVGAAWEKAFKGTFCWNGKDYTGARNLDLLNTRLRGKC